MAAAPEPAPRAAALALKVVESKPTASRSQPEKDSTPAARSAPATAEPLLTEARPSGLATAKPAANDVLGSVWKVGDYASTFGRSATSIGEINEAVLTFVRGESAAALAHMRALTQVRSAGDLVRLQIGEFQRAADASLVCLSTIARSASRIGGLRRL